MTVHKTDDDLKPPKKDGPELVNIDAEDKAEVEAIKKNYPTARAIEKLASGSFAVRFRRKATKYLKR